MLVEFEWGHGYLNGFDCSIIVETHADADLFNNNWNVDVIVLWVKILAITTLQLYTWESFETACYCCLFLTAPWTSSNSRTVCVKGGNWIRMGDCLLLGCQVWSASGHVFCVPTLERLWQKNKNEFCVEIEWKVTSLSIGRNL